MIKFVVFDFDGVFTTGKCYFDSKNNIIKYYDVKDGMALSILKSQGILSGLISNYSSQKNLLFNEVDHSILEHLKFDYSYMGPNKKIHIIDEWIKELKIDYSNIAYIGDDINDIPILEKVGYSGCPNNAIQEVKDIVKYICKNNGGEGCVREFVDLIVSEKKDLIEIIKKEAMYQLKNMNYNEIYNLAQLIKDKNVYFTGIGKSGNMAFHITSLLKSVGIKAFYLDPTNATHGDIGTIMPRDIVIFFSKSGNTIELINLIILLKKRNCKTVGIVCDDKSKFEEYCDICLRLPFISEIKGEINNIPTNSCMSQLFFGNILVSILKDDISIQNYKLNHPSGDIGDKLKKVKDVMIKNYPILKIENSIDMHSILLEMTKHKIGCCFFINQEDNIIGLLTDGDIRRILLNKEDKKIINREDINQQYIYIENIEEFMINIHYKNKFVPIINEKKIIGVIRV